MKWNSIRKILLGVAIVAIVVRVSDGLDAGAKWEEAKSWFSSGGSGTGRPYATDGRPDEAYATSVRMTPGDLARSAIRLGEAEMRTQLGGSCISLGGFCNVVEVRDDGGDPRVIMRETVGHQVIVLHLAQKDARAFDGTQGFGANFTALAKLDRIEPGLPVRIHLRCYDATYLPMRR